MSELNETGMLVAGRTGDEIVVLEMREQCMAWLRCHFLLNLPVLLVLFLVAIPMAALHLGIFAIVTGLLLSAFFLLALLLDIYLKLFLDISLPRPLIMGLLDVTAIWLGGQAAMGVSFPF